MTSGRIFVLFSILIVLIIGLYAAGVREEGTPQETVMQNMSTVFETMNANITNSIKYHDPWNEEPSMQMVIDNIMLMVFIPLMIEVQTMTAIVIHYVYKYPLFEIILWGLKIFFALIILRLALGSIKPIGLIYLSYEEITNRMNKKVNRGWLLLAAVISWLTMLTIFLLFWTWWATRGIVI